MCSSEACGGFVSSLWRTIIRVAYRVGIFWSVFLGIYHTDTERKTRSVFSVSKLWREPLKKLAVAPFFLRRGGLGPLFVHFTLLLKKKGIPGNFSKKEFPQNLKKVFPPKLTVQQYRSKNTETGCIWYRVNTDTKKMTGTTVECNTNHNLNP